MNKINKVGLAFPAVTIEQRGDPAYNQPTRVFHPGMSLRTYFAGQIIAGMAASEHWADDFCVKHPEWLQGAAETAVAAADALIAELEKKGEQ